MSEVIAVESSSMTVPDALITTLETLKNPVVVGHVRPDADCLGSMFAAAIAWPGEHGSMARVSLPEGSLSRRLRFMWDWVDATVASPADFASADGFVAVDTAKKPRCNVEKSLDEDWDGGRTVVNIDHHESNTNYGTINYVDAEAGSACELVYRVIRAANHDISPIVASLLYAGIHSDTLGFSLPTTTASALEAAADLVACGARVSEIGEHLCRSQSESEFNLNRVIYANTKLIADGQLAYSTASYDEITSSGCVAADIDDQVGIPLSLDGIDMAILFTEGSPGYTRLNLRGEKGLNVLEIAGAFGGGGHLNAAGAILNCGIPEAVERVLPVALERLDKLNNPR